MIKSTSFIHGQLNHLFSAWRQAELAEHNAVATPNNMLNGLTYLLQFDTQVTQHLSGNAFAFAHQAEQKMLRANVIVVEAMRLFLGQRQHIACSLREFVESLTVHQIQRSSVFSLECFAHPLCELI